MFMYLITFCVALVMLRDWPTCRQAENLCYSWLRNWATESTMCTAYNRRVTARQWRNWATSTTRTSNCSEKTQRYRICLLQKGFKQNLDFSYLLRFLIKTLILEQGSSVIVYSSNFSWCEVVNKKSKTVQKYKFSGL